MYRGIGVSFIEACLFRIDIKWSAWEIYHGVGVGVGVLGLNGPYSSHGRKTDFE